MLIQSILANLPLCAHVFIVDGKFGTEMEPYRNRYPKITVLYEPDHVWHLMARLKDAMRVRNLQQRDTGVAKEPGNQGGDAEDGHVAFRDGPSPSNARQRRIPGQRQRHRQYRPARPRMWRAQPPPSHGDGRRRDQRRNGNAALLECFHEDVLLGDVLVDHALLDVVGGLGCQGDFVNLAG